MNLKQCQKSFVPSNTEFNPFLKFATLGLKLAFPREDGFFITSKREELELYHKASNEEAGKAYGSYRSNLQSFFKKFVSMIRRIRNIHEKPQITVNKPTNDDIDPTSQMIDGAYLINLFLLSSFRSNLNVVTNPTAWGTGSDVEIIDI